MVVLGTDAHKRSHTVVAVDVVGAEIGSISVAATVEGHLRLVQWATQWNQRRWAIEDCRALSVVSRLTCSRLVSRWCGCLRS